MPETKFDVLRARQDTPGCEQVLHFNNAGAALMPNQVLDVVAGHLQLDAEIGGYEAAEAHEAAGHVYAAASRFCGSQHPARRGPARACQRRAGLAPLLQY